MVNKPKNKGTAFETAVVRYLRWALSDERIDRSALHGNNDTGDIIGIYYAGSRVVVECKNTKQPNYAKYWQQTLDEMGNADTEYGLLVRHLKGVGYSDYMRTGMQEVVVDQRMLDIMLNTHREECSCVWLERYHQISRTSLYSLPLYAAAHWLNHSQTLGR